jgi:hypothetical protein
MKVCETPQSRGIPTYSQANASFTLEVGVASAAGAGFILVSISKVA